MMKKKTEKTKLAPSNIEGELLWREEIFPPIQKTKDTQIVMKVPLKALAYLYSEDEEDEKDG